MNTQEKIVYIRSFGYWVRECSGEPVKYIIVDPNGDEEGWILAGDESVLDETIDTLQPPLPITVKELANLLKQTRDKALQDAIDVCEYWKKDVEETFKKESQEGNLTSYGKINLLNLCIQRIKEKITGV